MDNERIGSLNKKRNILTYIYYSGFGVWGILILMLFITKVNIFLAIALFALGCVIVFFSGREKVSVEREIKEIAINYIPAILTNFFDHLEYYKNLDRINDELLNGMKGLPYYNVHGGHSDHVKGVFHGREIEYGELKKIYHYYTEDMDEDRDVHEHNDVVLEGALVVTNHNLQLSSDVTISQFPEKREGPLTGNPLFNNKFSIITDNINDANVIIDPKYASSLVLLVNESKKIKYAITFKQNGTLLIFIHGLDLFEAGNAPDTETMKANIISGLEHFSHIFDTIVK